MPWKRLELTEDDRYALRTLEKKTRSLVDENVHAEVVRFLRAHGWNVKNVDDGALRGHCDEDVLAFAHREDRILLTHDRGFLNDRQFPPNRNPGVVILPGANGNEERLVIKRDFYAEMCRVEGWSTRVLARKVSGMLYERTALSKKPEELIRQELAVLREKGDISPALVSSSRT